MELGKVQKKILKVLNTEGNPLKTSEIAKKLKLDTRTIRGSAKRLVNQNLIASYKQGNNLYWQTRKSYKIKTRSSELDTNEKKLLIKGLIEVGEERYGKSHSGFIGANVLRSKKGINEVSENYNLVEWLIEQGTEDMIEEQLWQYSGDVDKYMKRESPFGDFTTAYVFDRNSGKVEFFGDDGTVWNKIVDKYNELKTDHRKNKSNKIVVVYYPESGVFPTPNLGNLERLIE